MNKIEKRAQDFIVENLPFSDIESYLKLPSGKSYPEIKEQAEHLSVKFSIPTEEAVKYMFRTNGFPLIENSADAITQIIKFNFGIDIKEFGLLKINGKLDGFCFIGSGREWQYITYSLSTKKDLVERLMHWLIGSQEQKSKAEKFLATVKKCINFIGHDFYSIQNGKCLDEVLNIYEINIDIEKLLHNGSGCNSTMRYALASCYNDYDTARSSMSMTLLKKHRSDGLKTLKVSDESARYNVYNYMNTYQSFGAMCINLDDKNKELVKELIDNYCGW
jgi:hypothetical protein